MFALIIPSTVMANCISKKSLVNLGELVGLETYNLLCMAVPTSYLEICHCSVTINFVIDKKFKTERNTTIIVLGELKRFYSSF